MGRPDKEQESDSEQQQIEQQPQQPVISNQKKYFLLGALIISGFMNTIAYQFQNTSYVKEPGYPDPNADGKRKFFHPYMQAVAMFMGEAICIFLFLHYKATNKEEYEKETEEAYAKGKKKANYFLIALPALSDACTSTLQHVGLVFISPSIYQMLRGGTIAIIAIASKMFLKKRLQTYQYVGVGVVILGISIVGAQSLILGSGGDGGTPTQQAIAIGMILVSLFSAAFTYISEEYLLRKYHLHQYEIVGFEGIWGLIIYLGVFLPILNCVECHLPAKNCVWSNSGTPNFERIQQYFNEMIQTPLLCTMCILGVFSISMFNVCGLGVTRYISSLTRSVVDQIRTILVWAFSLIITWSGYGEWENTSWESILLELFGFSVLMVGQVTYQGIYKWKCCPPEQEEAQQELRQSLAQDQEEEYLKKSLVTEDEYKAKNYTASSDF